jgi:uncharacterized damage-inducible protein DinB
MPNLLSHHFLTMAYNNAWSNHRLLRACAQLSHDDVVATRTSFFPSIKATLNHILTVDWFYIDALERELHGDGPHPNCYMFFEPEEPFDTMVELQREQSSADGRLIAYCSRLTDEELERYVIIERPGRQQRDTRARLLAHLFQHQIHHRAQVHAMLAGTSVKPPQLDEFFSDGDASLREGDFVELGWTEGQIWGSAPDR